MSGLTRVCAWCDQLIDGLPVAVARLCGDSVTHGMCDACYAVEIARARGESVRPATWLARLDRLRAARALAVARQRRTHARFEALRRCGFERGGRGFERWWTARDSAVAAEAWLQRVQGAVVRRERRSSGSPRRTSP